MIGQEALQGFRPTRRGSPKKMVMPPSVLDHGGRKCVRNPLWTRFPAFTLPQRVATKGASVFQDDVDALFATCWRPQLGNNVFKGVGWGMEEKMWSMRVS